MRIFFFIASVLAAVSAQAADCPWDLSFVSSSVKPLPAEKFRDINRTMTVQSIVKQLGPAARDVGSGVHVLQWDVTDGRTFLVSTASACGKPMNSGFYQASHNNSLKPTP